MVCGKASLKYYYKCRFLGPIPSLFNFLGVESRNLHLYQQWFVAQIFHNSLLQVKHGVSKHPWVIVLWLSFLICHAEIIIIKWSKWWNKTHGCMVQTQAPMHSREHWLQQYYVLNKHQHQKCLPPQLVIFSNDMFCKLILFMILLLSLMLIWSHLGHPPPILSSWRNWATFHSAQYRKILTPLIFEKKDWQLHANHNTYYQ